MIKEQYYILFKCTDCGELQAFPSKFADGHSCMECRGFIEGIGKYTKDEIRELFGRENDIWYYEKIPKTEWRKCKKPTVI